MLLLFVIIASFSLSAVSSTDDNSNVLFPLLDDWPAHQALKQFLRHARAFGRALSGGSEPLRAVLRNKATTMIDVEQLALERKPNASATYFRNVTDFYELQWRMVRGSERNESERLFALRRGEVPSMWMRLYNPASAIDDVDYLVGEASINGGAFVDGTSRWLKLHGFYASDSGQAFLIGTPAANKSFTASYITPNATMDLLDVAAQDFSALLLRRNASVDEWMDQALRYDSFELQTLREFPARDVGQCYWKFVVRVDPLERGASNNDFWRRRRRRSNSAVHAALARMDRSYANASDIARSATQVRIGLSLIAQSPNCGVELVAGGVSVDKATLRQQLTILGVLVAIVSFVEILASARLFYLAEESTSTARRLSMLMLGGEAVLDSYHCLAFLVAYVMREGRPSAFALAAFLKFVSFAVFHMSTVLLVWRAREPSAARGGLARLYCMFYGVALGGFVIIYACDGVPWWMVLALYSFWTAQAVSSVWQAHAFCPLPVDYVLTMSVTRILTPLYLFACPRNVLHSRPNWLVWLLVAWLAFWAALLLFQRRYGARIMAPAMLNQERYDYVRELPPALQAATPRCSICLSDVEPPIMLTPCNHAFHRECLSQWIARKLICPTCRAVLPEP